MFHHSLIVVKLSKTLLCSLFAWYRKGCHLHKDLLINQEDVWDLQLMIFLTAYNDPGKGTALSFIKGKGNSWTWKQLLIYESIIAIYHQSLIFGSLTYWQWSPKTLISKRCKENGLWGNVKVILAKTKTRHGILSLNLICELVLGSPEVYCFWNP